MTKNFYWGGGGRDSLARKKKGEGAATCLPSAAFSSSNCNCCPFLFTLSQMMNVHRSLEFENALLKTLDETFYPTPKQSMGSPTKDFMDMPSSNSRWPNHRLSQLLPFLDRKSIRCHSYARRQPVLGTKVRNEDHLFKCMRASSHAYSATLYLS